MGCPSSLQLLGRLGLWFYLYFLVMLFIVVVLTNFGPTAQNSNFSMTLW